VVDVTGGGNAYCGGFLVGWVEHGDIIQAAARAAVSAAITLEQVGPPTITSVLLVEAQGRLAGCIAQINHLAEQRA
jgi:sugar/nucleoside kinase (ribokinase family)